MPTVSADTRRISDYPPIIDALVACLLANAESEDEPALSLIPFSSTCTAFQGAAAAHIFLNVEAIGVSGACHDISRWSNVALAAIRRITIKAQRCRRYKPLLIHVAPNLETLSIHGYNLADRPWPHAIPFASRSSCTQLTHLDLVDSQLDLDFLASFPSLRSIKLVHCRFDFGFSPKCPQVERLHVASGSRTCHHYAEIFPNVPNLRYTNYTDLTPDRHIMQSISGHRYAESIWVTLGSRNSSPANLDVEDWNAYAEDLTDRLRSLYDENRIRPEAKLTWIQEVSTVDRVGEKKIYTFDETIMLVIRAEPVKGKMECTTEYRSLPAPDRSFALSQGSWEEEMRDMEVQEIEDMLACTDVISGEEVFEAWQRAGRKITEYLLGQIGG